MAYSMDYIISLQLFIEKKKTKTNFMAKTNGKITCVPKAVEKVDGHSCTLLLHLGEKLREIKEIIYWPVTRPR